MDENAVPRREVLLFHNDCDAEPIVPPTPHTEYAHFLYVYPKVRCLFACSPPVSGGTSVSLINE